MLEWLELLIKLLVAAATLFSSITLGLKNIDDLKRKTKKKRRFP
ncbi:MULTISPECIES: hypothetical protein [Metabacillus]|uniref:Holin-like toxin n=1 Tax=Metabacillus rhizosphaerae TaxID=3117747 RepID=A0ABZ2MXZ9_9BACI|nr:MULTISPECIES: hypothetical protein [Metabacillus]